MNHILRPPDKIKNYQGYMVFMLTIIWSAVTALVVVFGLFYFPQLKSRWAILLGVTLLIAIVNLSLNYYGHTRKASWSLTIMLWLYITVPCYSAGGIFAPGILSQMAVILTAGFLLGRRGGLAIGLLTIAADFALALLEVKGQLPAPTVVHDPISRWISAMIPIITILVMQYYAINHLRSSLRSMQRETLKRRTAVAQREQAFNELVEREKELEDYKYALDISSIVAISNVDGAFLYVNENFCKVSKYSAEELIGKTHDILFSGYHPPEYFDELGAALMEGKPYRGEFCNKAKDGSYYWVDTTIVPFVNDEGEVYQYISINSDITAKKEAVQQLRINKERYKSIIEVSNIGAWEYDLDTQRVWYSSQYFSMLGFDRPEGSWEDTLGISWVDRLHPDDRENAVRIFNEFLNGTSTDLYENFFRMRHKSGDWVWIWSRARKLQDHRGNLTNISLGTHTDISARVKAEQKTKESEQLIRKITSQVPGNTYMFEIEETGKLNFLFVNRGTEEYNFTADLADISRNPDKILEVWHEDDRSLFVENMKKAYKTERPISFQYRIVVDGVIRWRWLQAVPEKDQEGKVVWYGATRDVTALVDYIASAEQILYDISHVLRRPICSMLGITTLISEGNLSPDEALDLARQMHPVAKELDKFMKELNQVYEQKKHVDQLNINFAALVDKRNSLFERDD
ncbi:PAS domain-containing protein [Pedobacter faecalis]|uniref:PAS domain-containing protein n=1 Tax=Pedobacter faecalis TaxID=3041495 RepID=UPI00254D02EA|nr:PAS domain-containing protein [Pedobacter sp. ELA7]